MKRIKSLGVAAVLALALTSLAGASTASAAPSAGFFAEYHGGEISGDATANHYLGFPGAGAYGTLSCSQPQRLYDTNFAAPTNALALDAENGSCQAYPGMKVTVSSNGCQFIFHPATSNRDDTVEIGPAGCGPIMTTGGYCQFSIPPQTGLAADIENVTDKSGDYLRVEINATGIKYTTAGGLSGCNKGTTYANGTYSGGWNVGATVGGVPIDLRLAGLSLTGEASESPVEQPKLVAPKYPAAVAGEQSVSDPLVFGFRDGFVIDCKGTSFTSSLASAASSVPLGASYSACASYPLGASAAITMNSCAYELNVLNAGPPYSGTVDVECSKAGDKIEMKTLTCQFKLPAQQGLGSVALSNSAGVIGEVTADVNLTGVTYEAIDGFLCPLKTSGTFSDGTYGGTALLSLGWS